MHSIPAWFLTRLHDSDPGLTVYFNPFKGRWVIDRCTEQDGHVHGLSCRRVNVKIVQGEHGEYRELSDSVIEELRRDDMWEKYKSAGDMQSYLDGLSAEYEQKSQVKVHDMVEKLFADSKFSTNKEYSKPTLAANGE